MYVPWFIKWSAAQIHPCTSLWVYVSWLIDVCAMIPRYLCHDALISVQRVNTRPPKHIRAQLYGCMCYDSWKCVPMMHWYMCHDSWTHVPWLVDMCAMTNIHAPWVNDRPPKYICAQLYRYMCHDASIYMPWPTGIQVKSNEVKWWSIDRCARTLCGRIDPWARTHWCMRKK